ncbi:MAG: exonuclease subunit SbcD [Clostridiales bacterium]|jgi:exonuclease SbcD|nr:exonuclease subunit SbcD [Clostridiales bacterium]
MRILHTADWHLGAYLGPYSRIAEQALFLAQLNEIVDDCGAQLVLVAGDIFDTANPSAAAERLFFDAMAGLTARGVAVALIAGNHDSPERLSASSSLTAKLGITTFSRPGVCEIAVGNEVAAIAAMPFISEKRLNEAIFSGGGEQSEADMQKDFSAKVGEIFARQAAFFRADSVNIAMGHFHLRGGEAGGGLERDILLGGSFAVNSADLPAAQYIALGHLHRPQKVGNAHYSGSPLPYSLHERYPKAVFLAEIAAGQEARVEKIVLNCPKPVELWQVKTAAEALARCKIPSNSYVYINITDESALNPHDIKEMHRLKSDIVQIGLAGGESGGEAPIFREKPLTPREEFIDFYSTMKGAIPNDEILAIFGEILTSPEGGDNS